MKYLTQAEYTALVNGDATATIHGRFDLYAAATRLVERAKQLGLVLTIEQQPLQPLAMGHYDTLVSVREARK